MPVGEAFAGLLPFAEGEAGQLDPDEPGSTLAEPDLDGSTVDRAGFQIRHFGVLVPLPQQPAP